jgi:UDP-glucose 4-epimerase
MKLLVTGGAGYIGSHTAHLLNQLGHQLVVLDNLYSGQKWAVPSDAEFVEGDVSDRALLKRLMGAHKFDGILHFAAHIEVAESVTDPVKYYRNNVVSALNLFEAARFAKVPNVIFSSTAAVYGEPKTPLISETAELMPINPYGASKMMAERLLQDLCVASDGQMKSVVLRYFNAAGARRDLRVGQATPRATHLIKIASEVALGLRPSVAIYGTDYPTPDGTCVRDYIHIEDLAQAHVDALNYLAKGGVSDVFNVGYGRLYSVREVIDTMKRISGVEFAVVESPRRAGDPASLGANSARIRDVLGWKPQFDNLELICKTAFEWEKTLQSKLTAKSES